MPATVETSPRLPSTWAARNENLKRILTLAFWIPPTECQAIILTIQVSFTGTFPSLNFFFIISDDSKIKTF